MQSWKLTRYNHPRLICCVVSAEASYPCIAGEPPTGPMTKETKALIESHIQAFEGDAGRDTFGVPLINLAQMNEIQMSQWKHVSCIQDPPGVQLYTQTGTVVKGGHCLLTHHCARGSTSFESFHLF